MKNKEYNLYYLKMFMGLMNFIILAFLSAVIITTTRHIRASFAARDFLDNITYIPREPVTTTIGVFIAFFLLLGIIEIRQKHLDKTIVSTSFCVVEIVLCLLIMNLQYMTYNGIMFLVVADIVTTIQDKHNRKLFFAIMCVIYIFADYNVFSFQMKMVSFQEFLGGYSSQMNALFVAIKNCLFSVNLLAFIAYMIILMRNQVKENARIALLNVQLETANQRLKEMNIKLQDYAVMQKQMGEANERNRIAREIHDTLGHTMTGLSAGIDACIAMIDFSIEGTKKQLNLISEVARQGIKDIRRSVNKLRPDALEQLNLEAALEKLIKDTMKISNVVIHYNCSVSKLKFNPDEEDMIYRVVQEGITNSIRHGKATEIDIDISKNNKWLTLTMQDNGIGCEDIHTGFGLIHIEERITMLNGNVSYNGSNGFKIVANIPIRWGESYD